MSEANRKKDDEIYHLDTKKALSEHLFSQRESGFVHAPLEREMAFYESVRSGNLEAVKNLFTPLGGEGFGKLSNDPLQNLKYHLVVSIALITRFCINGGLPHEEAYNMSDVYIQQTDMCTSKEEIDDVHLRMVIEFTKRMRRIVSSRAYSKTVNLALDYISDHLHDKILVKDIADSLNCTLSYISRIFHEETGMPISSYISQKKVEAAANMLQYSDYSASEISCYLNFSSQSYFIKVFKKYIGISPKEYKKRFYAVSWMKPENLG